MVNSTTLPTDSQVLSIVCTSGNLEELKKTLIKLYRPMADQLIDEDHEEMIFEIPVKGSGIALRKIREALNKTGIPYTLSILNVYKGRFERPKQSGR